MLAYRSRLVACLAKLDEKSDTQIRPINLEFAARYFTSRQATTMELEEN